MNILYVSKNALETAKALQAVPAEEFGRIARAADSHGTAFGKSMVVFKGSEADVSSALSLLKGRGVYPYLSGATEFRIFPCDEGRVRKVLATARYAFSNINRKEVEICHLNIPEATPRARNAARK